MELFPAADDETWDFIKEQIDDSDYYVVLVGGRYGSLAPDGLSFTEKEYDYAREREVPVIGFVHADRKLIPYGKTETDSELVKKLDTLITKIKKRPVRTFVNPHQLASEVTASFVDLKRTKPRIGFVRTDQVVEYKKYAELLEKNVQLEKRLNELISQDEIPFPGHDQAPAMSMREGNSLTPLKATWGDVFLAAASLIIDSPEEAMILTKFNSAIVKYVNISNIDAIKNATGVTESSLANLREALFTFGLIDFIDEHVMATGPTGQQFSRRIRLWKLTDYGRRQFVLLRSVWLRSNLGRTM
jgi:hypothetical protein